MGQKTFQELDLTDAFLFAAVLEDPETCQMVVEIVLGRPVGPVKVQVEKSLLFAKDFRYVRFDVFYSGKYRYTFREICQETGEKLGDGSCKIFLSTVGTNEDEVPAELIHFLKYIERSDEACVEEMQDDKIRELNQKVMALKKSRKLEEAYMTFQEMLDEWEARGEAMGKTKGENLILDLVSAMAQDGQNVDYTRLKEDAEFRAQMLEKYHLKKLPMHSRCFSCELIGKVLVLVLLCAFRHKLL